MSSHKKLNTDLDDIQNLFNRGKFDGALTKVSKLIKKNTKGNLTLNIIEKNFGLMHPLECISQTSHRT